MGCIPLAAHHWEAYKRYKRLPSDENGYRYERVDTGSKILTSPHSKNGTILQAAAASEFSDFDAFKAAIRALPLEVELDPTPRVAMRTLRGKNVIFKYGTSPKVDGNPLDYSKWKLFEGPYLNAKKGSRKLTITHGDKTTVRFLNLFKQCL